MAFKKLSTDFWTPEEKGDELVGVVKGKQNTSYGEAIAIQIGEDKTVLLNYTALNDTLATHIDKKVKIVYTGEETSKSGRTYKDFDIYVDVPEGKDDSDDE